VFGAQDLALLRVLAREIGVLLAVPALRHEPGGAAAPLLPTGSRGSAAEFSTENDEEPDDVELARTICEVITTELEPDRLIESALGAVARSLPAGPVALHLIDGKSGLLVLEGQVEGAGPADRNGLGRGGGLTGMVIQTGHPVATGHPEKDPRFEPEIDTPSDGSLRPLICVPVRVRGKTLGVLRAFPLGPESARARTAEVLAATVSAAVRNVLLYRSLLDSIDEVARARRANRERT
jgi:GAF domain-containing protein